MVALAALVGMSFLRRTVRRLGDPAITEERIDRLSFYIILAVMLGGRLMHVLVETVIRGNPYYVSRPWRILAVWEGGLVMYGGLIAVFCTILVFARRHQINVLRLLDVCTPALFLGQTIGRWGCFLVGDDYGKPTDSWIGVVFTHPETLVPEHLRGVPLHPTQLYMSAKALIIFLVTLWVSRHKRFDGQVAGTALMLYAVLRSIVELFRGDVDRGSVGPLSTAQLTSIFIFLVGVVLHVLALRRRSVLTPASASGGAAAQAAAASPPARGGGSKGAGGRGKRRT